MERAPDFEGMPWWSAEVHFGSPVQHSWEWSMSGVRKQVQRMDMRYRGMSGLSRNLHLLL